MAELISAGNYLTSDELNSKESRLIRRLISKTRLPFSLPCRNPKQFYARPDLKFSEFINENSPEPRPTPFRLEIGWFPENFIFRTLLRAELFFKFGQRR